MKYKSNIPEYFHPAIRTWFSTQFPGPTEIQLKSWAAISRGGHVLMSAATGSGKTLAAFLWSISALFEENLTGRILYISPLKALNNDIQRNLSVPLGEIREIGAADLPLITTGVRSGDSSSSERARILRHPPDIFVTTPETINIMLTSESGRHNLSDISCLILDEIHMVAGSKRGSMLMANVERLEALIESAGNPPLQRIGISATVRPMDAVAAFLGGFDSDGSPRPVSILADTARKNYEISIHLGGEKGQAWWDRQIPLLADSIRKHKSSLVFCNSRRTSEKAAHLLNAELGNKTVFAHHGSLSREYRYWVEQELKEGRLKAVCATSSLELGIDVGSIDNVILLQAPFSVSSGIQRIGRANHQVGASSRAVFAPLHPRDILKSLSAARRILSGEMEELTIPENCGDVLAQLVLSECAGRNVNPETLWKVFRRSWTYRNYEYSRFEELLEMLGGKYRQTRISELQQRIIHDKSSKRIEGRESLRFLIYQSGGTIPDRGYFDLRIAGSDDKLGELDEEFVFERSIGDRFTLGNRVWQIDDIDNRKVSVSPSSRSAMIAPFWKADNLGSDPWYAEAINIDLEEFQIDPDGFRNSASNPEIDQDSAAELKVWLEHQQQATGGEVPHRHHILVEELSDPSITPDMNHFIFHTGWGSRVNAPFMYCLNELYRRETGLKLQSFYNDESVICSLPIELSEEFDYRRFLDNLGSSNIVSLISSQLMGTGIFGARFRANAGRSLLVLRRGFNTRTPLWLQRMKSKNLMEKVISYGDFPIVRETWRELLEDEFGLSALQGYIREISDGEIRIGSAATRSPSPFAADIMWQLNSEYLYADDSQDNLSGTGAGKLLAGIAENANRIPWIDRDIIDEYLLKRRRLLSEYRPESAADLEFYLYDRRMFSPGEVEECLAYLEDLTGEFTALSGSFHNRAVLPGANKELFLHRDIEPQKSDISSLALEWFDWQAFVDRQSAETTWGGQVIADLIDRDELLESGQGLILPYILERLLRLKRRKRRQLIQEIPLSRLQHLAALQHGILGYALPTGTPYTTQIPGPLSAVLPHPGTPEVATGSPLKPGDAAGLLQRLNGYTLAARVLRDGILPARFPTHGADSPENLLDPEFHRLGFCWTGTGSSSLLMADEEEIDLFLPDEAIVKANLTTAPPAKENGGSEEPRRNILFETPPLKDAPRTARFRLEDIRRESDLTPGILHRALITGIKASRLRSDSFLALRRFLDRDWLEKTRETGDGGETAPEAQPPGNSLLAEQLPNPDPQRSGPLSFRDFRRGRRPGKGSGRATGRSGGTRRDRELLASIPGNWFTGIPGSAAYNNALDIYPEDAEAQHSRLQYFCFLLLERYPILSRDILSGESSVFVWRELLPVLRNLELSGELTGGKICPDIEGLQFAAADTLRLESSPDRKPAAFTKWFWLNSRDPALMYRGLNIRKSAGNYLIFLSDENSDIPIAAVENRGRDLRILPDPDAQPLPDITVFARIITRFYRDVLLDPARDRPSVKLQNIESSDGIREKIEESLVDNGFQRDPSALLLWRY